MLRHHMEYKSGDGKENAVSPGPKLSRGHTNTNPNSNTNNPIPNPNLS